MNLKIFVRHYPDLKYQILLHINVLSKPHEYLDCGRSNWYNFVHKIYCNFNWSIFSWEECICESITLLPIVIICTNAPAHLSKYKLSLSPWWLDNTILDTNVPMRTVTVVTVDLLDWTGVDTQYFNNVNVWSMQVYSQNSNLICKF